MNLKEIPFFENLSDEKLKRLEEISFFKRYKKDDFLFFEGEKSEHLLILTQGMVKIYKTSSKNREILLHTIFYRRTGKFRRNTLSCDLCFCRRRGSFKDKLCQI